MKKNAWNIRRLVDELFVQASHRAIVIYFRLSDFLLHVVTVKSMVEISQHFVALSEYMNFT